MPNLPLYKMVISSDTESELEVDYVALVDKPAIEKNFLKFDSVELRFNTDADRRIISGPAMLADTPIYRRDADMGEYLVTFDAATIEQIAQKFFRKGFNQNFNLMHNPEMKLSGVTVFESFIVDPARGIQPMKGFEDSPAGSWFISAKVDNDEAWKLIQEDKIKGFSVEGIFQYKKAKLSKEETWNQIEALMISLIQ